MKKTVNLFIKSGKLKFLLGLAAAGVLLFAGCPNMFDPPAPQGSGEGEVRIIFTEEDEAEARTVTPDLSGITRYLYAFTETTSGKVIKVQVLKGASTVSFMLPKGEYTAKVEASTGSKPSGSDDTDSWPSAQLVAEGTSAKFNVEPGEPVDVYINLVRYTQTGTSSTNIGNFALDITYPAVESAWVLTYKLERLGISVTDVPIGSVATTTPATGKKNDKATVSSLAIGGNYRLTIKINTPDAKYLGITEAVHIARGLTTTYSKEFFVEDLAEIRDADEAVRHLKSELVSWITDTTLLAEFSKGSKSKPVELDTAAASKTAYVFYVKGKSSTVNTVPVTLKGGWFVDATPGTAFSPPTTSDPSTYLVTRKAGAWPTSLSATADTSIVLRNYQYITSGAGTTQSPYVYTPYVNAEYKVEFWPVAEYRVKAGKSGEDFVDLSERSVSVLDKVKGNGTAVVFGGSGATLDNDRCIGMVGSTDITLSNAAILLDSAAPTPLVPANPGSSGVLVYNFNAASKVYNIVIYETVEDQTRGAFRKLRENLNGTQDWVVQKEALANKDAFGTGKSNHVQTPADIDLAVTNKSTLYYVDERMVAEQTNPNLFTIRLPSDKVVNNVADPDIPYDRWEDVNWGVFRTSPQQPAVIQVKFTPFGGAPVTYEFTMFPVAEFKVFYVKDRHGNKPTGSIKIKDVDIPANTGAGTPLIPAFGEITFTADANTDYGTTGISTVDVPKVALIGSTTIDITDVAVTVGYDENKDNTITGVIPAGPVFDATTARETFICAVSPATNNADVKNGIYTLTTKSPDSAATTPLVPNMGSRVYEVRVYPNIATQTRTAVNELKALSITDLEYQPLASDGTTNDGSPWITKGTADLMPDLLPSVATNVVVTGAETGSLDVRYVGTTKPTFARRNSHKSTNYGFAGKGWSADDASVADDSTTGTGNVDAYGTRAVKLTYTPLGGFSQSIFTFNLVPVVQYEVLFRAGPTNVPMTGNITVNYTGTAIPGDSSSGTKTITSSGTKFYGGLVTGVNATASFAGTTFILANGSGIGSSFVNVDNTKAATTSTVTGRGNPSGTGGQMDSDRKFTIYVYPPVEQQKVQLLTYMRDLGGVPSKDWFGSLTGISLEDIKFAPVNPSSIAATDITSVVKYVGTSAPALAATIDLPNDDYNGDSDAFKWVPDTTGDVAADATKGTVTKGLKVRAIGEVAGSALQYKFTLAGVAKYHVQFMAGPNGNPTSGLVSIEAKEPVSGTSNVTTANPKGAQFTSSDVYYSASGTADGGFKVDTTAAALNVFIVADSSKLTSGGKPNADALATADADVYDGSLNTTSKEWWIFVYPSVQTQRQQALDAIRNLTHPLYWNWTTGTAGVDVKKWFSNSTALQRDNLVTVGSQGDGITADVYSSYVQYMASSAPNVTPLSFANADYAITTNGWKSKTGGASTPGNGITRQVIEFAPIGKTGSTVPGAAAYTAEYTIDRVGISKYQVRYGVQTPDQTVVIQRTNPGTATYPDRNETDATTQAATGWKPLTNGIVGGTGNQTKIKITGDHNLVALYDGAGTQLSGGFTISTVNGTGADAGLKVTTVTITSAASQLYEVYIVKMQ